MYLPLDEKKNTTQPSSKRKKRKASVYSLLLAAQILYSDGATLLRPVVYITASTLTKREKEIQVALFVWLISHQPTVFFSQNKPATSNQPAVLFSQNKSAPAISHQPTEQAASLNMVTACLFMFTSINYHCCAPAKM
jgi:hypothetical protein